MMFNYMANTTCKWCNAICKTTTGSQNIVVREVTLIVCYKESDIFGDYGSMNCYCFYVIGYVSRSIAFMSVKKDVNCA